MKKNFFKCSLEDFLSIAEKTKTVVESNHIKDISDYKIIICDCGGILILSNTSYTIQVAENQFAPCFLKYCSDCKEDFEKCKKQLYKKQLYKHIKNKN